MATATKVTSPVLSLRRRRKPRPDENGGVHFVDKRSIDNGSSDIVSLKDRSSTSTNSLYAILEFSS